MHVPPLVEACCDTLATALAAQAFGAGRIELCGLGVGGSTPSHGLIARCVDMLHVPLHVMIRPSIEDFVYSAEEFDIMCDDVLAAQALGVDGIVLGILHDDLTIDVERMAEILGLAHPLKVAFHRAFDHTPNASAAMDALLQLGVDFVLTSGHAATALDGADRLRSMQHQAGDDLIVLAGGGIRAHNVRELVTRSGVREVHARATDPTIVRDVVLALTQPDLCDVRH